MTGKIYPEIAIGKGTTAIKDNGVDDPRRVARVISFLEMINIPPMEGMRRTLQQLG